MFLSDLSTLQIYICKTQEITAKVCGVRRKTMQSVCSEAFDSPLTGCLVLSGDNRHTKGKLLYKHDNFKMFCVVQYMNVMTGVNILQHINVEVSWRRKEFSGPYRLCINNIKENWFHV